MNKFIVMLMFNLFIFGLIVYMETDYFKFSKTGEPRKKTWYSALTQLLVYVMAIGLVIGWFR